LFTWRRAVEIKAMEVGNTWRLKELMLTGSSASVSKMPYAPEQATGIDR
jgi:hypothetical protein